MQRVRMYFSLASAKDGMDKRIEEGWRVCTCAIDKNNMVIVVYEKEGNYDISSSN